MNELIWSFQDNVSWCMLFEDSVLLIIEIRNRVNALLLINKICNRVTVGRNSAISRIWIKQDQNKESIRVQIQ